MILDKREQFVLNELPKIATAVEIASRLRKTLNPERARAVAAHHALRAKRRQSAKDGRIRYLTARGLEQATAAPVAAWRARILGSSTMGETLWDATCGLGADTLALLDAGVQVVSSDLDRATAWCARENLLEATLPARVVAADVRERGVRARWLLLDPDRRAGGRRSHRADEWSPSLDEVLTLMDAHAGGCVKLAPGLDYPEPLLGRGHACWVSLRRELKEVALWFGRGHDQGSRRSAVALDGEGCVHEFQGVPEPAPAWSAAEAECVAWLADPDPSLLRSDLLGALCKAEDLRLLAPRLAWVGSHERPLSPLLKARRVLGSCPVDRKHIRRLLAEHEVGPLEVWKRGHPDPAEESARRFRGTGSRRGILALGRLEAGHRAWLLDPDESS